jgi:phosphoglycolate phosphatase-like HAD superfamily hydrolase
LSLLQCAANAPRTAVDVRCDDPTGMRLATEGGTNGDAMRVPLRGMLFDVDGTLLDSNEAHARAWQEALAEQGIVVEYRQVRPLIGMGGDKVVPLLTPHSPDGPVADRLNERRGAIFRERYLPSLRPFPKARDLLVTLGAHGRLRATATSATASDLRALLAQAGVADALDVVVSSDDVDRSKPDPDIVAAALAKASLCPEETVLVGDTPYDVAAARRAGVRAIALRSGGWTDDALGGAIAIYDDVADLCAHLDEVIGRDGLDPQRRRA